MKTVFYFLIIVFIVSACKKENISNQVASDYFPNTIGDTWHYVVNDTTVNRSHPHDSTAMQYNMTVMVVDSIHLQDGTKANVWVFYYPGAINDTNYVYTKGDTIHFENVNETKYSEFPRQYIVPLSLHQSWQYSVPSINDVTIDRQSDVSVGSILFANSFHIWGYSGMPDATFLVDEWVEESVGIVKRRIDPIGELIDPRHVRAWSLVSFHLN